MGGDDLNEFKNDVWRSTDNGATWTQVNSGAGWAPRLYHSSVVMPDGSIVLMGGIFDNGYKNDVWRFITVGSSAQKPSHTYQAPGVYTVALQVYNYWGYASNQKTAYINVTNGEPLPSSQPLNVALDNQDLNITTSGDDIWFNQSDNYYFNGSAAQSGHIGDNQQSVMQTSVTGPATMSFYWSVSSEENYDYLIFYLDNVEMTSISGEFPWVQEQYTLDTGNHELKWVYQKDYSVFSGMDCGWVDKVEISNGDILLVANFTANPIMGQTPLLVQFNDTSTGLPVQWNWSFGDGQWFNTTDIALRNVSHIYQNAGNYTVNLTVTNNVGSDIKSKIDLIVISSMNSLPGFTNPPTDPDNDGLYEDLNANNRKDFNDVVLMFNQMQWIAANEPVGAFDFNGNGRIDFNDIVKLFGEI
jgi:PKD repeat protein